VTLETTGRRSPYRDDVAYGVVKFWKAERGWGAISSDELPPGRDAFAHFSHIMDMPGYRTLEVGQAVEFTYEAARQDGFDFRAIEVRLAPAQ
jgi:CspA family cold shock protein